MIQVEVRLFQNSLFHDQLPRIAVLDIDHCLDILRQGTHHILYKDERVAQIRYFIFLEIAEQIKDSKI